MVDALKEKIAQQSRLIVKMQTDHRLETAKLKKQTHKLIRQLDVSDKIISLLMQQSAEKDILLNDIRDVKNTQTFCENVANDDVVLNDGVEDIYCKNLFTDNNLCIENSNNNNNNNETTSTTPEGDEEAFDSFIENCIDNM